METVAADALLGMFDDLSAAATSLSRDIFPQLTWREDVVADRLSASLADRVQQRHRHPHREGVA